MKKITFLAVLLALLGLVFASTLTAQEQNNNMEDHFVVVSDLIKNGLYKNYLSIQEQSKNLTNSQRLTLYSIHENKYGVPLLLNFLVGFGIGSAVQKDTAGAIIGCVGDTVGSLLLSFGLIRYTDYMTSLTHSILYPNDGVDDKAYNEAMGMWTASYIILGATRIFEIIKPLVYSSSYNNKLKEGLGYNGLSFDLIPATDVNGGLALTALMTYSY